MGMQKTCGYESLNPSNIIRYIRFKIKFAAEHPEYFDPDGLLIFVGPQGSGKSLSAVNYTYKLLQMYPNSKICTNLLLTDYPIVTFEEYIAKDEQKIWIAELKNRQMKNIEVNKIMWESYVLNNRVFPFVDNDDFIKYGNGEKGIIFLVDEISLYLNSLESKNVNLDVVTQISQQRKQRKHIVATSQVFGRMAKPLREQFSSVVLCKQYFGCIQKNSLIDRDSIDSESSSETKLSGKVKQNFVWIHNPDVMYERYDTFYVIEKGKFVSGENQKREGFYNDNNVKLSINN